MINNERTTEWKNKIYYSQCWEDPYVLLEGLDIQKEDKIISITSGGCNTLALLLKDPREVIAIDINPVQNPMLSICDEENYYINAKIYPAGSGDYVNRDVPRAGMVEPIVDIFKNNGFDVWGGGWKNPIDYHHFQVNRELAEKLCIDDKNIRDELWARHLQSNLKHI